MFSVDLFFVCLFLMVPSWGKLKQAYLLVQKQLQPGYKALKLILVKFTGVFVIQYVIPMSIVPHKEGKRQHFWVPKSDRDRTFHGNILPASLNTIACL